ncbi:MAG TPA: recombinase family protein, partial [Streptosporangiaceae bacterium]
MRALLLARKSNKVKINDATYGDGISLETQDEVSRAFADAQGWEIVDIAGDTVSGRKVSPFEREKLGPWLTDPALIAQWDVLVAAAGDRISRERIEYWSELEAWAVKRGKKLVVCERGGVYFPPRHEGDEYNWTGIKSGAGKEWDVIRGRIIRSQCRIMRDGGWCGRAPFGYVIAGAKYSKALVIDSATAKHVREIFDRAIKGDSLRTIGKWLEAEGVKTERGRTSWPEGTVKQLIDNQTYSGAHTRGCAECEGTHDLTVPAIVDPATQTRAQAAMKSRRRNNGGGKPTKNPAMLIPLCQACGIKMYRIIPTVNNSGYYYCKSRTLAGVRVGCGVMVRCDKADTAVDVRLSADTEDEMTITTTYPAEVLESEIVIVRRAERKAFDSDDMDKVLELRAGRLELEEALKLAEIEHVEAV